MDTRHSRALCIDLRQKFASGAAWREGISGKGLGKGVGGSPLQSGAGVSGGEIAWDVLMYGAESLERKDIRVQCKGASGSRPSASASARISFSSTESTDHCSNSPFFGSWPLFLGIHSRMDRRIPFSTVSHSHRHVGFLSFTHLPFFF